jgi:hypothetical protein
MARQRQLPSHATGVRRGIPSPDRLEARVERLLRAHAASDQNTGLAFAAWVPRFFGQPVAVVLAREVTREDAQLVVARSEGFASWAALREASITSDRARHVDPWQVSPWHEALCAVHEGDLVALQRIVRDDASLLTAANEWGTGLQQLLRTALRDPLEARRRHGAVPDDVARTAIVRWLETRGADVSSALGPMLVGRPSGRMRRSQLAWLLALGADADWVAPNGLTVLEHALLGNWEPEAVDLLVTRISSRTPRDALWLAAGIGDVVGVKRCFDARGRPLPGVRLHRPDYSAVQPGAMPVSTEPTDPELVQEAFWVAARQGRTAVLRALMTVGGDPNGCVADIPYLVLAVVEHEPHVVAALLACGADADATAWRERTSARDLARRRWLEAPSPRTRRIAELLGHDPEQLRRAHDATPTPAPVPSRHLEHVFALATEDARRCGAVCVDLEHVFVGLLRAEHGMPGQLVRWALGAQLRAFVAMWRDRLQGHAVAADAVMPRSPSVQATLDAALVLARTARSRDVTAHHVLAVLVIDDDQPIARLLLDAGADLLALRAQLAST